MGKKPTYEELEQRVKELEKEALERKRAGEALRESEEKHKTLTENSLTGIFILQDGRYVFVNDRFAEIHGYKSEEMYEKYHLEFIHPDERDVLKQITSRRLNGEAVPQRYEVRRLRKDGKTVWCEMMAARIQHRGKPATMGNIIDINEHKLAEESLRQSTVLLQHIADHLPVMFSYIDSDRRYIYANRQLEDSFGPGTVVGKTVEEVLDPEIYKEVKPRIDAVLAGDDADYERIGLSGKGDKRGFLVSYRPDKDESGDVNGFFALLWDITEIKQKEEALRESELWMRSMFNSMEEAVFIVTPDRVIVDINEADTRMFGYSKDELMNRSTEILHVDHEHYLEFGRRTKDAFDKGQATRFEFDTKKKNGEIYPSERTISLLKDDKGKRIGILSVVRDLSERKKAEE